MGFRYSKRNMFNLIGELAETLNIRLEAEEKDTFEQAWYNELQNIREVTIDGLMPCLPRQAFLGYLNTRIEQLISASIPFVPNGLKLTDTVLVLKNQPLAFVTIYSQFAACYALRKAVTGY